MKTIFWPQHSDPNTKLNSEDVMDKDVFTYEHENNTTEGSEFLDDGIRTKDQPFDDTTVLGNEPPSFQE